MDAKTIASTKKRMSEGKKVHNSKNVLKMLNAYAVFLLNEKGVQAWFGLDFLITHSRTYVWCEMRPVKV